MANQEYVSKEIKRLGEAAVDIAQMEKTLRHKGGYWLHNELKNLYEDNDFSTSNWLDFMAVVKILLDLIFRDAVEGDDMVYAPQPKLELPPGWNR